MAGRERRRLCLTFACIVAVFTSALDGYAESTLKDTFAQKLSEVLHEPVEIGDFSLSINPPVAILKNLLVGKRQQATGDKPLAEIESLEVDYDPISILEQSGLRLNSMRFKGVRFHVGVDEQGRSTFQSFLSRILDGKNESRQRLPTIDRMTFEGTTVTFYVHRKIMAPVGERNWAPVVVSAGLVELTGLAVPANEAGKADSSMLEHRAEHWIQLSFAAVAVTSPRAEGGHLKALPKMAGHPDEGMRVEKGQCSFRWIQEPHPLLRIEKLKMTGGAGQSLLDDPKESATFVRIYRAIRTGLMGAPLPVAEKSGWSLYIDDIQTDRFVIEWAGQDAVGRMAWWRWNDMRLKGRRLSFGRAVSVPVEDPGYLELCCPTESSEGNGSVSLKWTMLSGSFPEPTLQHESRVERMPLAAMNTRLGNKLNAGFDQGMLTTEFGGAVKKGKLDLDGYLLFSPETRLVDEHGTRRRTRNLARMANGLPVEPVRIKGTVSEPKVEVPQYAIHALHEVGYILSSNPFSKFVKRTVEGGARTVRKVIEEVSIFGDMLEDDGE